VRASTQEFFVALKRNVTLHWHPDAGMGAEGFAAAYGYGERYTELCVRVDAAGRLAEARLRTSSGIEGLDRDALQALQTAQPFPSPPSALAAPDGSLSFAFAFVHDVDLPAAACALPQGAPAIGFGGTQLAPVCARAYVDPAAPPERVAMLRAAEVKAVRRLADLFGPLRARPPLTIYCESDPCRVYFSGPARRSCIIKPGETAPGGRFASASEPTIVVDRTDARAVNELAHDLAHVELRARVGEAFIPQWFNDGLATLVSDEPACSGVEERAVEDLRSLDGRDTWQEMQEHVSLGTRAAVYCEARRVVEGWIAAHGKASLRGLLEDVASGVPFYDAYERPRAPRD
jgi:TonB family protein